MKKDKIVNIRKINKMRWLAGIIMSIVAIVVTLVSVTLNILDFYNEGTKEAGLNTLKMFTTLSNIMAAIAAFMCLPFQINGLKKDKYKLPNWIIILLYVGAVGTFVTFIFAITLISATKGFVYTMFGRSNIFMHTINPIIITLLFVLILSDSHIKFRTSFISLIPIVSYALLYFIMVFVTKVWKDHYNTNTFIPWPVSLLLVLCVAFGASQLLRILHNITNKYVTTNINRYYLESSDYDFENVSKAVMKLAEVESKFYYEGDDIYIPCDIIALLQTRYSASIVPLDILYDIYLESYLRNIKKEQN